ncbi:MAG: dihydroneopterin aldolase [Sphingomicrobium sp.]|nr:dihydroneopterin aldolase [Sphingomonadales bacterium]
MSDPVKLHGMVPDRLKVRQSRILLDRLEVMTDIGFHAFEIGSPQRLLISVELWLDPREAPCDDEPSSAWDYDFLREEVRRIASARRYNLQETLVQALFERFAACHGVQALRVASTKPDIYADARGVGVEIASFQGTAP